MGYKELDGFEGVLEGCESFGEGEIRAKFKLKDDSSEQEYLILGRSVPPLEDGRYVEGFSFKHGLGRVVKDLIVRRDEGEGKALHRYTIGPSN